MNNELPPVSVAYRITMSPHEWTWTQSEQEEMARTIVSMDAQLTAANAEISRLKEITKGKEL